MLQRCHPSAQLLFSPPARLLFSHPVMSSSLRPVDSSTLGLLSLTISWSLCKFMSIASMMPSSHLILWRPLLLSGGLFQWVSCLHQVTKALELQLQSFQWVFRVDFPWDWLVLSPSCPRDSQESSPGPQFEGISSLALCLLDGPALTTVRDHLKDRSLDYMDLWQQSNVSAFHHTV